MQVVEALLYLAYSAMHIHHYVVGFLVLVMIFQAGGLASRLEASRLEAFPLEASRQEASRPEHPGTSHPEASHLDSYLPEAFHPEACLPAPSPQPEHC